MKYGIWIGTDVVKSGHVETKSRNLISNAIRTFTECYPNWKERVPENSFPRKGNLVPFLLSESFVLNCSREIYFGGKHHKLVSLLGSNYSTLYYNDHILTSEISKIEV